MDKLEALLIGGYWPEVMEVTFGLLIRAGFTVDVISNSSAFRKNGAMRDYVLAKKRDLLVKTAAEKIKKRYTLVVVGDDATLGVILNSDLSGEQKLRLLPVLSGKNFGHIFSKIGLSLALKEHGINTPDSRAVRDGEELNTSAHALGYPILVKLDSSAGGVGVFECRDGADVEALGKTLTRYPVLVQRKIAGPEVALEAFYRAGNWCILPIPFRKNRNINSDLLRSDPIGSLLASKNQYSTNFVFSARPWVPTASSALDAYIPWKTASVTISRRI